MDEIRGKLTLITGGARSGKSAYAESLAASSGQRVAYVATAEALDDDMRRRIARHRAERPAHWRTVEAPRNVADMLRAALGSPMPVDVVLIDCLTLWATNVLLSQTDSTDSDAVESELAAELNALIELMQDGQSGLVRHWIVVTNEVGLGIVPDNALARQFRDLLGRANQRLARIANDVVLMVAGIPMCVKSSQDRSAKDDAGGDSTGKSEAVGADRWQTTS